MDFLSSRMTHSNLGGFGPDSGVENMRVSGVGYYFETPLDLVVEALSGYATSKPEATSNIGAFVQINMLADHDTTFRFCFVEAGTDTPVAMEAFKLVFHDLDDAGSLDPPRTWARERVSAGNFSYYKTSADMRPPVATELEVVQGPGGQTHFYSTTVGTGKDNAQDSASLTDLQRARLAEVYYANTACVSVGFAVMAPGAEEPGGGGWAWGRNLVVDGGPGETYPCMHGTPSPPVPPPPPAAPPPCDPTNGPLGSVDGLDFTGTGENEVIMGTSNLGGFGPDVTAPEGVTFFNVGGTNAAAKIGMSVHALSGYMPWKPDRCSLPQTPSRSPGPPPLCTP